MVTLSRVITSCGGTVSVTMRKSTLLMREMNGGTRKRPGPFAPVKRPNTKITPRSYCCTTRIAERARITSTSTTTPTTNNTSRFIASLLVAVTTGYMRSHEWKPLDVSVGRKPSASSLTVLYASLMLKFRLKQGTQQLSRSVKVPFDRCFWDAEHLSNLAVAQLGAIAQQHDCAEARGQRLNRFKEQLA